jgi:signal transduction histidine kinase
MARGLNVQVEHRFEDGKCPSLVDPPKIGSVIGHLLQNALDVSSSGQKIIISTKRGGSFSEIKVMDQGPGIRAEYLPKIFSPFFTTKDNGQGLALAVCKKTMKDLGGDIRVESALGKGAEFTLTVPRGELEETSAEAIAPLKQS